MLPSEQMTAIGIRQLGDPILREVCRDFDLPREKAEATALREQLLTVAGEAMKVHTFTKGIGVAAPQIGIPRAASILVFPDAEPLFLLNARIVRQADDHDEQFEGLLPNLFSPSVSVGATGHELVIKDMLDFPVVEN